MINQAADHGSDSPPLQRAYLWRHVMVYQSSSLSIGTPDDRIRRLSVALLIANRRPFRRFIKGEMEQHQALLVSPRLPRSLLEAQDSDLTIIEINVAHPVCHRFHARFAAGAAAVPTTDEIGALQSLLAPDFLRPLSCAEIQQRFHDVLEILGAGDQYQGQPRDARIEKVIELVEQTSFDEISMKTLANAVGMSESRLRHFFNEQMDCSLGRYIRWANAWKALLQWHQQGVSLSEAANDVGFYDRAHLNRALREQLFESLSAAIGAPGLRVHACY